MQGNGFQTTEHEFRTADNEIFQVVNQVFEKLAEQTPIQPQPSNCPVIFCDNFFMKKREFY